MHTPGKVISLGSREYLVFLGIVKVLDWEPGLLFAEWGGWQFALAVVFEGSKVVLQAGN
jgi:hypothetical protein